jgi:prepilin-type N-terminal cleavage/methylation domain-containing protein
VTRLRAEHGFSLVELLVTVLILGVILGATLTALEAMGHQAKLGGARSDAQDGARTALDQISQRLRSAVSSGGSAVDRSGTNDLVVRVVDDANPAVSGGANAQRLMFERFCVDAASSRLYEQVMHWTSATATVPSSTACPATTGAVNSGTWETRRVVVRGVTTAGGDIFSYVPNASTPSRIGIDVSVDADTADATPASRLRSTISLRNLDAPPSVTINCVAAGSGQVICDSAGTADPDGQPLTYQWSYASGAVDASGAECAGTTTAIGTGQTQVNQAGLTPGPYCFKLVGSDPSGMSGTAVMGVTAR